MNKRINKKKYMTIKSKIEILKFLLIIKKKLNYYLCM